MKRHIVFTGASKFPGGLFNLWTSDGTLAGTHEIKIAGLDPELQHLGLGPGDYIRLGDRILLTGWDRLGGPPNHGIQPEALWVTDGTSAGTYEIGGDYEAGIKGAGHGYYFDGDANGAYGFDPSNFISFGDRVEFFGYDKTGYYGIWITDGTAKGTIELGGMGGKGIKGAYFDGLHASNFVACGDKLLFQGIDKFNHTGIWVTDGTTKGTVEIGGARNAGIKGSPDISLTDLGTGFQTATEVGSKVFFNAFDKGGNSGLWVTDGTAKGTVEIGGVANAGVPGTALGETLSGTHYGVLDGKLLFSGPAHSNNSYTGLWLSDGTVKGTSVLAYTTPWDTDSIEISGNNAWFLNSDGLWETNGTTPGTRLAVASDDVSIKNVSSDGLDIVDFAVAGDKAVFIGTDASDQQTLWVTDGTKKGTVEIGGLNNHGVKGVSGGGLRPTSFVSAGDIAYFTINDPNGHINELWVTDGTAQGTFTLDYVKGASSSGLNAFDLTLMPSAIAASFTDKPVATHSGFVLSGEIVDDYAIKSVELFDGAKHLGSADTAHGKWTVTKTLGKGFYDDLKIVATDAHGRTDRVHAGFSLVIGASARDHLSGGTGRDFIEGLAGGDTLKGGKGADTFIFRSLADSNGAGSGRDVIADFHHAEHDHIDLNLIDAVAGKKGDQKFHFIGDHDFKHAGDLRSETVGANTLVSGDVNGDGRSDFALLLHGKITLHAGDFIL